MEVEESFDALFRDYEFENSDWMLSLVRKCISTSPGEREVLRAVEISLCFFLKKFDVEFLEEEVFQISCPVAKNIVSQRFNDLEKNPSTCAETFSVLLKILSIFGEVFDFLNGIPKITVIEIKSLVIATSEILLICFSHCKVSEKVYGSLFNSLTECLSNFFKKCCSLQDQLLHTLTEKVECDMDDDREILLLDQVMSLLSKLGTVLINLEVKTMAKVWKSFVVLTDRYLTVLKTNYNIGETIQDLCVNITSNMNGVLGKDKQDFSKIIKLNCFLLKLVIKFSEAFTEYLRDCQSSLLNLLLMLCRYTFFITTENLDLMNQLTIGTNPLLCQLLTDVKFIKECRIISKEPNKSPEFVVLCCLILKKLQESFAVTRNLWLTEKDNILDWIFLSASSSEFLSCTNISLPSILINGKQKKYTDLYEYVLVTTSAFLMTTTVEEFHIVENTLIVNVLQLNPIRGLLAIDIWCIMARFADSELCYSQVLSLGKMFEDLETSRIEKCNLGSLIRRLFPLLLDTHKEAFLKSFKPRFYCELWNGIYANKLSPKEACDIYQILLNNASVVLNDDEAEFQKIIRAGSLCERICRKIPKLWGFNCELLLSTCQSLDFLKIVCMLTAYVVSELSSEDLLMVLSQIKKVLSTTEQPSAVKLFFIWILHSLSTIRIAGDSRQKKIIATIAEIFRNLLTSKQALVKEKAFETFYSFSHITKHGEVVSMSVQNAPRLKIEITDYFKRKPPDKVGFSFDDYIRELYRFKVVHVCQVESPVLNKKMKFGTVKMQDLVIRWKEDGKIIVEHFHSLSESQKREVRNICNSILSLPL